MPKIPLWRLKSDRLFTLLSSEFGTEIILLPLSISRFFIKQMSFFFKKKQDFFQITVDNQTCGFFSYNSKHNLRYIDVPCMKPIYGSRLSIGATHHLNRTVDLCELEVFGQSEMVFSHCEFDL